ncbi:MAG: hypothetical protein ACR2PL_27330, partial [Dehalococcoidia bacterium]
MPERARQAMESDETTVSFRSSAVAHAARSWRGWLLGLLLLTLSVFPGAPVPPNAGAGFAGRAFPEPSAARAPGPAARFGALPLSFEPNQGQAGAAVDFLAQGNGYRLTLTGAELTLALRAGSGTRDAGRGGGNASSGHPLDSQVQDTEPVALASDASIAPGVLDNPLGLDHSGGDAGNEGLIPEDRLPSARMPRDASHVPTPDLPPKNKRRLYRSKLSHGTREEPPP